MLGLKLIHVSKSGPRMKSSCSVYNVNICVMYLSMLDYSGIELYVSQKNELNGEN